MKSGPRAGGAEKEILIPHARAHGGQVQTKQATRQFNRKPTQNQVRGRINPSPSQLKEAQERYR
jgi:hypothetical protein